MDKRVYVSELENACLFGWLAGLGSVEYGGQSPPHHEDRSLCTGPYTFIQQLLEIRKSKCA